MGSNVKKIIIPNDPLNKRWGKQKKIAANINDKKYDNYDCLSLWEIAIVQAVNYF